MLWRFGVVRGLAKCLKLFSWKNDGYGEQKPKMKNTKKKSSSHKWVLGEILQKLKRVSGKKNRECNVYVYVCVLWATPATKRR